MEEIDEIDWARATESDFIIRCWFYKIFQKYIDRFKVNPSKELWPTLLKQAKKRCRGSNSYGPWIR